MVLEIVHDDIYGLRKLRGPVRTVIDIGANIGVFSIFAKLLFPNAKVIAVEPGESAFRFLSCNVSTLGIEQEACAIGAKNGPGSLIVADELTRAKLSDGESAGSQKCRIITFESLVERLNAPVDVLKLDCEGAEYDVLQSPAVEFVRRIRAELHTCNKGNPGLGLQQLRNCGFIVTKWAPFPGGGAGIVWADRPTF
ncbi:MAG: FkbM family methyltransferase [Verrucomicrobia subdivision 3 bacterium]|nr:FkbM family methyltransferase [Limisphaerales bacterium]